MFGYITIYEKELKVKEYDRYRSYYCGLCHTLKKRYGRTGQLLLNYDMTFLLILLTGLYEPKEKNWDGRCALHPEKTHSYSENRFTAYAADMTVLLAYEKAKDDWRDEHSVKGRILSQQLKTSAEKIALRWPRQAKSLQENLAALAKAEQENSTDIDRVSGYTGRFLAEIFVREEDVWQNSLRQMGFYLGKFVYLMDAWEDRAKDRKSGCYNLFLALEKNGKTCTKEEVRELLMDMMAHCCSSFERLPASACEDIIRNILYAGVWVKFSSNPSEKKDRKHLTAKETKNEKPL